MLHIHVSWYYCECVGDDVAEVADALLFVKDPSEVLVSSMTTAVKLSKPRCLLSQTCRATVESPNATRVQEYLNLLQPERLIIIAADPNYKHPLLDDTSKHNNFTILNNGHTIFRTDPFYKVRNISNSNHSHNSLIISD